MVPLTALGSRIVILGPSNAGKSTLAVAIAQKRGLDVIHLDRFRHLPNTDWQERPDADFAALHEAALRRDHWIMDGNYSSLLPRRLERATGAILLTAPASVRLARYIRRTLRPTRKRAGQLEGNRDSFKWSMIEWVAFKSGKTVKPHAALLRTSGKPFIICRSSRELSTLYKTWAL